MALSTKMQVSIGVSPQAAKVVALICATIHNRGRDNAASDTVDTSMDFEKYLTGEGTDD